MKLTTKQRQALLKLPKEEKIRALQLLEERERRERTRKDAFKPHKGQLRVIMSQALERYLFPGNGFGKTTLLVNDLHWVATGYNPFTKKNTPVPAKIALVVATAKDIDEVLTEYQKWHELKEDQLHKKGKPHVSFIDYDTGSTITIFTHEVNPMSLEGSQWTHIMFNEPPPKDVYVALTRGGRIKGRPLQVFLAGTPIAASWLYQDIYLPWIDGQLPFVECFEGSTHENEENLDEGYIARFSAKLTDKEKEIRLHGKFFHLDGLALAHLLNNETHLIDLPEDWDQSNPCVLVIDPHPSKAQNAVLLGVDKDEYQYVLEEYKEKAIARKFMTDIISMGWFQKYKITAIVYDSLGSAQNTSGEGFKPFGEVINEVLKAHHIPLRARATTYAEKSDEDFIERIRDSLAIPENPNNFGQRVPKLRFIKHCRGSYNDVKTVQWYEDKQIKENKQKLDIRQKDFLSCIKYGLATNLFFDKPRRSKPHYVSRQVYGLKPNTRLKIRSRRLGR
jgi:hypothetical protein